MSDFSFPIRLRGMLAAICLLSAVFLTVLPSARATDPVPQPNLAVSPGPSAGTYKLSAPAVAGRVYFFQMSPDLENWTYAPTVKLGTTGMILEYFITPVSGQRLYSRLRFTHSTNNTAGATGDLDHDGLTNADELTWQTDPFHPDTDGDGMPDGWELQYSLNPLSAADAAAGADSDGLNNLDEYRLGIDPTKNDTDEDGLNDNTENSGGTSPAKFNMPAFTVVSAWREAVLEEKYWRQAGGSTTHTLTLTGRADGTASGSLVKTRTPSPLPVFPAGINAWAGSLWSTGSPVIASPASALATHDPLAQPLYASRHDKMHGTGGYIPATSSNPNTEECRDITRTGTLLERSIRIRASRPMKASWTIPYTRSLATRSLREGGWSTTHTPAVFTFSAGQEYSNEILLSASTLGGPNAALPSRQRASATSPWVTRLFTSTQSIEWITIGRHPAPAVPPSTDRDGDGIPNDLELRLGLNPDQRVTRLSTAVAAPAYADGDQLHANLLPPAESLTASTRYTQYLLDSEDPECPYHPADRLLVSTDLPPSNHLTDPNAEPLGMETILQSRLAANGPFPSQPPAAGPGAPPIPLVSDLGGLQASAASGSAGADAFMGYTKTTDGTTEAADGHQRRLWLTIPEALPHAFTRTFLVTREMNTGTGTPQTTATLESRTIPAGSLHSSTGLDLLAKRSPGGGAAQDVEVKEKAALITIAPASGMAGVLGDTIPSMVPGSSVRHFVTPKKLTGAGDPAELKQDHVILTANGLTAEQITPGHAKQTVLWDTAAGEAVPGDPLKWRVSRAAAARHEVKIKMKTGGATVAQMNVWVVWATCTATPGTAEFVQEPELARYRIIASAATAWRFKFTILPAEIINPSTTERPDLGDRNSQDPPGFREIFAVDPTRGPADSARTKWDVSRRQQARFRNPSLISKRSLQAAGYPDAWFATQPAAAAIGMPYPSVQVAGNDDALLDPPDEDTNPYAPRIADGAGLEHALGEVSSIDLPNFAVYNGWGDTGRQFAFESNFQEFARVELWNGKRESGSFWFRISDFYDWHHYLSAIWQWPPGRWIDNGSETGSGHPVP